MKVFYFCGPTGVKILEDLEIKITPPSEFNDPFEFYPYPDGPAPVSEQDKRECQAFHKASYGFFYFVCFCRHFKSPRMWAQYAANHKGLMFEFNLIKSPFQKFTEGNGRLIIVDYKKRSRVPLSECRAGGTKRFQMASSRKGRSWQEEEEIRLMVCQDWIDDGQLEVRGIVSGEKLLHLWKISEPCIVSVTTALFASEDLKHTVKRLLEARFKKTRLFQAKCHLSGFTMVREEQKLWRKDDRSDRLTHQQKTM